MVCREVGRRFNLFVSLIVFMIIAQVLASCTSIGPKTIYRDRFDYNEVVARSWQEQMLLNIVKTRYLDMPVFLDVAQIVSGYTLETTISLSGTNFFGSGGTDSMNLGAAGKWIDRPTITYNPLTGAQFNRNLLTPVSPFSVLFMLQSGWSVNPLLPLAVTTINGIDSGDKSTRQDYLRLLEMFEIMESKYLFNLRVIELPGQKKTLEITFREENIDYESAQLIDEFKSMLGLEKSRNTFQVVYGIHKDQPGEIDMRTRSMMQIIVALAACIDIPEDDLLENRASRFSDVFLEQFGEFHIKLSTQKPEDALVVVPYRNKWFWIDDRDLASKRIFAIVMILYNQMESGGKEPLPLITIPTG